MPVKSCQENNKSGYKWGESGSCYTYTPNDKTSKEQARKKAIKQGVAITISQGKYNFKDVRVSFDYDGTLSTDKGKKLLENEQKQGNLIYIISARKNIEPLKEFAKKHNIRLDRVFATGSNKNKVEKIKELNISKHYDNSNQVKDIISKTDGLKVDLVLLESFATIGERGGIKESKKAPKSDTPNSNPKGEGTAKGNASSTRGAVITKEIEETLRKKVDEFNDRYKEKLKYGVNIGMLKSVYQRGIGAYNVSHSPQVKSAGQWAYARVNAFLYLVKNGRPENKKYTGDYDLLPKEHPKNTSK